MNLIFVHLYSKRLLLLFLIFIAVFSIQYYFPYPQNVWCTFIAFMLALIDLGNTIYKRMSIILLTGILTAIFAFAAGFLATWPFLLAVFLAVLAGGAFLLTQRYSAYFFVCFTIILFAILSGAIPPLLNEHSYRFGFILLGTFVVVFLQIIFSWQYVRKEVSTWLGISLAKLSNLTEEIFSCFLHLEYIDYKYLFERRLHVQKNKFMQSRLNLQNFLQVMAPQTQQNIKPILNKLDDLYALLLDLAQLRRRVSDYTTFSLCHDELLPIATELKKIFQLLIYAKQPIDINILLEKITRFEDNYAHVLNVAAKEPLVFLLFISSMKQLAVELQNIFVALMQLKQLERI